MTKTKQTPPSYNIRAVTRALSVLTSFSGARQQTLTDVANATGLDKGTVRRLLLTLMEGGFVAQDSITHKYRLGHMVRNLSSNACGFSLDLRTIAGPHLMQIASDLSITTFLSVFRDGAAICLDRFHDVSGVEVHWWQVGGSLPLNVGAAPKLLLAYQPPDVTAERLEATMRRMSEASITDIAALTDHLALIRSRGWESAVDDVVVGLTALAVPILNDKGVPVCAVSLAGLTPQMIADGKPVHLDRLLDVAATIRRELFGAC